MTLGPPLRGSEWVAGHHRALLPVEGKANRAAVCDRLADATVIATKDGIPENVPSPHSPGSSDDA
jgi:hypothetical protein